MAYGGMRITPGVPIGERAPGGRTVGATGYGVEQAVARTPDRTPNRTPNRTVERPARAEPPLHCWVTHSGPDQGGGTGRSPGVLVEWQHDGDQWWGLVVFVADDAGHSMVVTRLVPAETLTPA